MCEPTSIIAGVTAVSTLVAAGSSALKAAAQNQRAQENTASANAAFKFQQAQLDTRQYQEKQAATQSILAADRQARTADAMARVSAGAAGVTGASVDAILAGIERDRLSYGVATNREANNMVDQLQNEKQGYAAERDSRINSQQPANPWAVGLQIGGDALGGISQFSRTLDSANKK